MTLIETCQAILDNPPEILDDLYANDPTYKQNMEYLCSKNVVTKANGVYLFQKKDLESFIENKGLTNNEVEMRNNARRGNAGLFLSLISLIVASLALYYSLNL